MRKTDFAGAAWNCGEVPWPRRPRFWTPVILLRPFWIDVFGVNCDVFCLLANASEGLTMLVYFFKYFFTVHLGSFFDRKQLQQLV